MLELNCNQMNSPADLLGLEKMPEMSVFHFLKIMSEFSEFVT